MIEVITLGLLNIFLIPFGFYRCWILNDKFSFRNVPLSYATRTHTKTLFSFYVVSIGLVQIVFLYFLFKTTPDTPTYLQLLPVTSMIALGISGIIHSSTNKLIHRSAVFYMVASLIVWSFLWHAHIYEINSEVGLFGYGLSLLVLIGCPGLQLYYKNFGMSELLFAFVTVVWNGLMIYFVSNL